MAQDLPMLMTPSEVAKAFRVSEATIRRWTREGRLTAVVFPPRIVRYRREDIEGLLTPKAASA